MQRIPKNPSRKTTQPICTPSVHGKISKTKIKKDRASPSQLRKSAMLAAKRFPLNPNGRMLTRGNVQKAQTLGIDYLEIPCSIAAKPDRVAPLLLGDVDQFGALRNMRYQCNECTRLFHNRRSWEKHKGIRWITDNQTEICT